MSKRKCINSDATKRTKNMLSILKHVSDVYCESVDSFIFKLIDIEDSTPRLTHTILKLAIVSETERSLPYFFKEFDDDYDDDNAF